MKFSRYHFYMNTNIYRDFQICISVPLIFFLKSRNNTLKRHVLFCNFPAATCIKNKESMQKRKKHNGNLTCALTCHSILMF